MWLFTTTGFFSVVQDKVNKDQLWIRARVRQDLEDLVKKYNVVASPVVDNMGTDYAYRITVWRSELVTLMIKLADDVDYTNFKDAVSRESGCARADVYHDVWAQMMMLQLKNT